MSQFISRRGLTWALCIVSIAVVALFQYAKPALVEHEAVSGSPSDSSTSERYDFIAEHEPQSYSASTETPENLGRYGDVAYHNSIFDLECCLSVAHAGGSLDGKAYTNSLEALELNYRLGRRVFELDFLLSTEGQIVLVHHWDTNGNVRQSREDFLARNYVFTTMDFEDLARWLLAHRDATIVTDTKDDFYRFIDEVEARLPAWFIRKHFVFQAYDFDQLDEIERRLPSMSAILTIYKMEVSDEALISELANRSGRLALTMPVSRALESLEVVREALPSNPIYVHGRPAQINAPQLHSHLQELGASGFYVE